MELKCKATCESATKGYMVMAPGKLSTTATLDYEESVRDAALSIGFNLWPPAAQRIHRTIQLVLRPRMAMIWVRTMTMMSL